MFVPVTRIVTVIMAGVLCFTLLVPMALSRQKPALAIAMSVVFVLYLIANIVLWQRSRPRA